MTDDEVIALGNYAEGVLRDDLFSVLTQQYERQCFAQFLQTDAKSLKEREGIYMQMRSLQDFLTHMTYVVAQRDKLIHEKELSHLKDADAPIDGID